MASALAVKTHTVGAGQFVEFNVPVKGMNEYYVNCGQSNPSGCGAVLCVVPLHLWCFSGT